MTKPQKILNFKFDSNFVITLKNTIIVNKVSMHLFKKKCSSKSMCVSTANPENVLLFWMKRKDDENSFVSRKVYFC